MSVIIILRNERTDFDVNWHKWSTRQGHERINFGDQEVKDRGHTRQNIYLDAWQRHRSRPLRPVRVAEKQKKNKQKTPTHCIILLFAQTNHVVVSKLNLM